MAARHRWISHHPILNQDKLAPCGMTAGHRCRSCRITVCQLASPCPSCNQKIQGECQRVRNPPGRPLKPVDPSKPRRKASREKAAEAMQLLDSLTYCASCNHGIFEGDAYCRHCGSPQDESDAGDQPSKVKTIYVASDLALSERGRETLLPPVIDALKNLGLDVHASSYRSEVVKSAGAGWAYSLGQEDFVHIAQAGAIFVMIHSYPPDEGVMVELGIAIALGKPTFLFQDNTRRTVGDEDYPLNLKLFAGMPRDVWRNHYYTSMEDITAPGKALARWARQ